MTPRISEQRMIEHVPFSEAIYGWRISHLTAEEAKYGAKLRKAAINPLCHSLLPLSVTQWLMNLPLKNYLQQGIKVKGKLTAKEAKYGAKLRNVRSTTNGCRRLNPFTKSFLHHYNLLSGSILTPFQLRLGDRAHHHFPVKQE